MSSNSLSVAQRVTALHSIFNDFGIPVLPNSNLDQVISSEFGRGKRSKLTPLLQEFYQQGDAARLATCIGAELVKDTDDAEIIAIGRVMQQRLPSVLEIIDLRQTTAKREQLLMQLLQHFSIKIPQDAQTERLHRMLVAAQRNLQINLQVQAVAKTAELVGVAGNIEELQAAGRVLQKITPALIALDQTEYPLDQKINLSIRAIHALAHELHSSKLIRAAGVLDNIHWLAQVSLPQLADQATIAQALQNLDISIGSMAIRNIEHKAVQVGLTKQEVTQMIYTGAKFVQLESIDQKFLDHTQDNQRYAAIFGYLTKLAQEAGQDDLAKIGIAGISLISLRQTFFEIKTHNLNAASFSESLGTILTGFASITGSNTLAHIGDSILTGVKTYAGIMAIPGGASIAIPLAVCTTLGKLVLKPEPKNKPNETSNLPNALVLVLGQVVELQQQMRYELAALYAELNITQNRLLLAMDHGFTNLASLLRGNNIHLSNKLERIDNRVHDLQLELSQEFANLYLEYIQHPLEELDFADKYGTINVSNMRDNKHRLAMWLLYKAKHPKVNGALLSFDHLQKLLDKLQSADAVLGLINRYLNENFAQEFPLDLPHIPTWIMAANMYVVLSMKYPAQLPVGDEEQMIEDILNVGEKILSFVKLLASGSEFWHVFNYTMQQNILFMQTRWALLQSQVTSIYMHGMDDLYNEPIIERQILAQSNHDGQLEPFNPINVEINDIWLQYLQPYLPIEAQVAVMHGLGDWQVKFTVDRNVNFFNDPHLPANGHILPEYARDVLFKLEVFYQAKEQTNAYLLLTAWLAYDLHDSQQRFDQYYQGKFKYELRHRRYHWISLDGLANQVEGHGNTVTQKLIDYEKLAKVYQRWFLSAVPVNNPAILARLRHNTHFWQQNGMMLEKQDYCVLNDANINILRPILQNAMRDLMLAKRLEIASLLLQDQVMVNTLNKIDMYCTIQFALGQILNIANEQYKFAQQFMLILHMLQQPETLQTDLYATLEALFSTTLPELRPKQEFLHGEFYLKVSNALNRLALLQSSLIEQNTCMISPALGSSSACDI
jgi:hypothetical protein